MVLAVAEELPSKKEGKAFSLFSVVQFENAACSSSLGGRNGTCFTDEECRGRGGREHGNCASGFGVCCVFIIEDAAGGTASQNSTFLRNPGFPTALPNSASTVSYTIQKCEPDICQMRLDFMTFMSLGPADTIETGGGACQDQLVITLTSGQAVPVVCGTLTGQHMYLDVGLESQDNVRAVFTPIANNNPGANPMRSWEILATQFKCNERHVKAPPGCLQWYTSTTGRFTTFNFESTTIQQHLANQRYSACIRQEIGMCCIRFQLCPEIPEVAMIALTDAFSIAPTTAAAADTSNSRIDVECVQDFISIPSSSNCANSRTLHTRYCGGAINGASTAAPPLDNMAVCSCTPPFQLSVFTNAESDRTPAGMAFVANTILSRGVCFDYSQIPCGSGTL